MKGVTCTVTDTESTLPYKCFSQYGLFLIMIIVFSHFKFNSDLWTKQLHGQISTNDVCDLVDRIDCLPPDFRI